MLGRYKVVQDITNEDKWFRFFTPIQLLILAVTSAIAVFIYITFSSIHLGFFALVFDVIFLTCVNLVARLTMDHNFYLYGGGCTYGVILKRVLLKKFLKSKVIYIKNYKESGGIS